MSKTIKGLHVLLLIAACTSIGYASGAVRPLEKAPPKIEMPLPAVITVVIPVQSQGFAIVATPINCFIEVVYLKMTALELAGGACMHAQSSVAAVQKQCSKVVEKYLGCERYYSCKANRVQSMEINLLALPDYNLRT